MDNILEIIIPAYNAKNTLDRTLSSICIQRTTYKFEVLIVNDKSDYDYRDFIDKYSKYINIRELTLKENVGPGGARQQGIEDSYSKYILFIDSDDYLYSPFSVNDLIDKIESTNSDLVISDFMYERDGKREVKSRNSVWLHGKIYRRRFLESHNIKFNNTRQNEDNGFNKLILLLEPKIRYLFRITYVYCENPNSITRSNDRLYKYTGLEGYAYNFNWAFDNALERNVDKNKITDDAIRVIVSAYFYYLELYDRYDVSKIFKWFKNIYNSYYPKERPRGLDYLLHLKRKENPVSEFITFDEFIKKLEEYND